MVKEGGPFEGPSLQLVRIEKVLLFLVGTYEKPNRQDAKRVEFFRIGTDDSKKNQALRRDMMILYSVTMFDLFTL